MFKLENFKSCCCFGLSAKAGGLAFCWLALWFLTGCVSHSTVQTRIQERSAAYAALPSDQQQQVAAGRILAGLDTNAVYMDWGKPDEILESSDQRGSFTTWVYRGAFLEETRYWAGRQTPRLEHDYQPRTYVRAEIVFFNGRVQSWRSLPQPAN